MHTPGPWHYENIVGHHAVNMSDGNSFTVDNEHDARLIAAAPRMLKVLRKVYMALQTIETGYEHIEAEVKTT